MNGGGIEMIQEASCRLTDSRCSMSGGRWFCRLCLL